MLRLNRFAYLAPRSLDEAIDLKSRHGEAAAIMAGGTDLLVNIKHRLATPDYVIGIRELPELQQLGQSEEGWLAVGAGVSLTRLERYLTARRQYPALAEACRLISTPQVRAVGTIGGNLCLDVRCNYYNQSYEWRKGIGFCLKKDSPICRVAPGGDRCWAVASADTVPVLMAVGAELTVAGPSGRRRVAVADLFRDDGLEPHALAPGELVETVHLPVPERLACAYQKFRIRHSFDFPLVGVAVALDRDRDGVVLDARIVMTAVASAPERAANAEAALRGCALTLEGIRQAGEAVFRQAKPMDNTSGTIFHRKRMARVLTERALRELAGLSEPIRNTA